LQSLAPAGRAASPRLRNMQAGDLPAEAVESWAN